MSSTAIAPSSPISSGEIQAIDFDRLKEVSHRHELLKEYAQLKELDGILIRDPANFSWLTCGGDNTSQGNHSAVAAIFVTSEARVVLCNNVDSGQIFDRELMGLGFLLKERSWMESPAVLLQDICRGRKIGTDGEFFSGGIPISEELVEFRLQHSARQQELLRQLGKDVAHAVEATARNFEPGSTESEIAGHLAHRLIKHHIEPIQLQVLADGQGWRYRHWSHGADQVERHCVISATGRRNGLHVSATRTVCLGAPPEEIQRSHHLAAVIQATGMYFSQHNWSAEETWKRIARIYEKFDIPDEWRSAEQACITGYRYCEKQVLPHDESAFQNGMAIFWHPSIRSSHVGDTILVNDANFELLTPTQNWPTIVVSVKGVAVSRPGILIREVTR